MKTLMIALLFITLFMHSLPAQQAYYCIYVPINNAGKMMDDSISFLSDDGIITRNVLITDNHYSFFYSFEDNTPQYEKRSLEPQNHEPVVQQEYDSAGGHYIHMRLPVPVFKHIDTEAIVYKDLHTQRLFFKYSHITYVPRAKLYTDTLFPMRWTLIPGEQKMFDSLHCLKATTFFRNREIIVWYCPDIPISDGPWKLGGLPGLIVSWEDPSMPGLMLKQIKPIHFPDSIRRQIALLSKKQIPGYDVFLKDVDRAANKERIYLQQALDNCVSCKGPDGKNRTKASVHARLKYEGIKYDLDLW